ncbi:type II toxin-antitoxin system PemK/MazF family toxin [Candidatus Woesearchaeota archaeon]|nr:type II toxin-antitoxin system PemK/MazF family toxin [Candidatus Woesearchaeota archaeon]
MSVEIPSAKNIIWTCCTLDGKNKEKEGNNTCPNHMFIVLTKKGYNERSRHFLAVPLSSIKIGNDEHENYYRLNYGINVGNDDIVNDDLNEFSLTKSTVVLCDRPTRVDKEDIEQTVNFGKIEDKKYEEIIQAINHFLVSGTIQNK